MDVAEHERTSPIEESILPTQIHQRPLGFLGYAWIWVGIAVIIVLMKWMVLPSHPQAEVRTGNGREYLATSEGMSWAYLGRGQFGRVSADDLGVRSAGREDI